MDDESNTSNAHKPELFDQEDMATLRQAVETWGIKAQADMAEEECAEFIAASKHYRRDKVPASDVIGELADIRIMCEQLSLFFGRETVEDRVQEKMERLRERLKENDV